MKQRTEYQNSSRGEIIEIVVFFLMFSLCWPVDYYYFSYISMCNGRKIIIISARSRITSKRESLKWYGKLNISCCVGWHCWMAMMTMDDDDGSLRSQIDRFRLIGRSICVDRIECVVFVRFTF